MKKHILHVCAVGMLLISGGALQDREAEVELQPDFTVEAAVQPEYPILTVYTPLTEPEVSVYFDAFEKDTNIRVEWEHLSTPDMLDRVQQERDAPQASVMFGGSSENYIAIAEQGLLEPYEPEGLEQIADIYQDAAHAWSPCYVGAICFAYNEEIFAREKLPLPQTWNDLLDPVFRGRIVMAHPSLSGTSYTIVAGLAQMRGEDAAFEYLKKLDENIAYYTKGGPFSPAAVGLGDAALCITLAHDALRQSHEGLPIKIIFPSDGTSYEIGAMALIRNADPREAQNARTFLDWVLSRRGQECYIDAKGERLPVNPGAKTAEGLTELDRVSIIRYDTQWCAENRDHLIERFVQEVRAAEDAGDGEMIE